MDGQSVTAQVVELRKHGASKVFREVRWTPIVRQPEPSSKV
jgi:hypothetical protein